MRITILSPGTTSDVLPFVALGKGLKDAGFEVVFASNPSFSRACRTHGLHFVELPGNPEELLASEAGEEFLKTPSTPMDLVGRFSKLFFPFIQQTLLDSLKACGRTNAIVASPLAYFGFDVSVALGVPFFPCALYPLSSTGEFPFPMIQSSINVGSFGNQMSYSITRQVFWQFMRESINAWRHEYLGLPPAGMLDEPVGKMEAAGIPFIYGFSNHVVKRPSDWPARHVITGFWLPEPYLPSSSDEILRSVHGKPVVFSFTAMSDRERQRIAAICARSLQSIGLQGVWLTDRPPAPENESTIIYASMENRDWILDRAAACVHHCDVETTAAVLSRGVPSVPLPMFGDNFFWARRMQALGVCTNKVEWQGVDSDRLSLAIQLAVENLEMLAAAKDLAEKLQEEDGVSHAVTYIRNALNAIS